MEKESVLDEVYRECLAINGFFKHRALLFIGSESYDAPTITVLEGLHRLGFTVYTLFKPNINSWFCNQVVDSPSNLKIDFVLSNLHWGTRWNYYERFRLNRHPKVLIDGDDNRAETWKDKHARYSRAYVVDPPEEVKNAKLHAERWMEPLGNYDPDVVFVSQKNPGDSNFRYLPFGIEERYKTLYQGKSTSDRAVDFTFIPGPGSQRSRMGKVVKWLTLLKLLPGKVAQQGARGIKIVPEPIRMHESIDLGKDIHSYHRWVMFRDYFTLLNNSRVLIYPGVEKTAWWDSKRPWEGYASGCLILMAKPNCDVSEYPVTEIHAFPVFNSTIELVAKCWWLYRKQDFLDKLRVLVVERAWKYFSSESIARYFLSRIKKALD